MYPHALGVYDSMRLSELLLSELLSTPPDSPSFDVGLFNSLGTTRGGRSALRSNWRIVGLRSRRDTGVTMPVPQMTTDAAGTMSLSGSLCSQAQSMYPPALASAPLQQALLQRVCCCPPRRLLLFLLLHVQYCSNAPLPLPVPASGCVNNPNSTALAGCIVMNFERTLTLL